MKKILFLSFVLCHLTLGTAWAQSDRLLYSQAETDYEVGRLEQAEQLLSSNIGSLHGSLKVGAYRLLALCYIGLDRMDEAESCAVALLREDPYYTTTMSDPRRFADMIERIKAGLTATITTASSRAEKLSEVPVPTTLITEDMILNSGARNLQELLAAYVPGMTIVDCNDDINIAMRGIYSNSQEKILIMLNGHRLNSYCTNIAAPDFSMSLEKIRQVEVLRGPASSLYGGVALTAVVNIITKQGADVDGVRLKAGAGSYGTVRADALMGKRYFDLDLLIWASGYRADGQRFYVDPVDGGGVFDKPGGDIVVGGVGNKPSYDVGINMKWKDLQTMYCTRFSQNVAPYSMSYLYQPYSWRQYKTYNGIRPSFATQTHHAEISYGRETGPLAFKGTVTYDNSDLTHYQVITEQNMPLLGLLLGLPDEISMQLADKEGIARYINGQEQTIGAQLKGDLSYADTKTHKGTLSFGAEASYFSLDDVRYVIGHSYNSSIPENNNVAEMGKGNEKNFNTFLQLKHQWRSFIVNAGLRYDHKQRYDGSRINEYSPRLALILLQPRWNVKLSYSKAFIDAPYLYRKTNSFLQLITQRKKPELTPEIFHAYQLTFAVPQAAKGLDIEVNGFYTTARDLIYMTIIDHQNTGNPDTYGLETTVAYNYGPWQASMNATWQKQSKSKVFGYDLSKAFNIPTLSANLIVGWQATKRLRLHSHIKYTGHQYAYSIDIANALSQQLLQEVSDPQLLAEMKKLLGSTLKDEKATVIEMEKLPARAIVNVGLNYQPMQRLQLGLNVTNLLGTSYYQSGMATGLIHQQGRWLMADVAYKF